ncbi:MAG: branched-chain amino acid ABC transporter permease [Actinobacteria bacterium]|nr:branched-chain amino acid ABC transporter permease [Actinomycetota bacterium]
MRSVLTNGLVIGAIYGLVAVGLALVFKKSRTLHFANAETGMIGAFLAYTLATERGWPYFTAAMVGVAAAGVIGGATLLVLAKRRHEPLTMLIGTLAVAGVLLFVGLEIWGPTPYFAPAPLADLRLDVLGLSFVGPRLLVLVTLVVLAVLFVPLFRYTRAGLLFRASATDAYAAELMGVNVLLVDLVTWTVAGALAGLAAVLVAPLVSFHVFFMTLLAIRGFAAALLAGMSNVAGSLGAGVALGMAESALTQITNQPGLPEAVLVVVIVAVLTLRPTQLAGRTV